MRCCGDGDGAEERRSGGAKEQRRRRSRRRFDALRLDSAAASLCSSSWRCCRCSSPSARRSMRCSTTLLPGYSQLHSAFRWVFPYTLSMAVLAGYGLDALLAGGRWQVARWQDQELQADHDLRSAVRQLLRVLGWLAVLAGAAALLVVLVSVFVPGPFVALGDRLLAWSDLARTRGFADGAMAWSYEAVGIARLGLMALLAGVGAGVGDAETGDTETQDGHRRHGERPASPEIALVSASALSARRRSSPSSSSTSGSSATASTRPPIRSCSTSSRRSCNGCRISRTRPSRGG